ncbi:DUF2334 domain-containing protein [Nocardia panacis]|uniref:DUF2334 domain-containing protein n=1 Tax=Nocardia panacis TaxID=2340916 RepID=A0A3A4K2S9_9NOCA|nr:polysaccharide deacetylase family protein [Nocardia panacis]RJO70754.1 DUF2334 domain-containing protein [Nocardia panacis]
MRAWGPDGRRAAACVTFDHLGEAAEIQIGAWRSDAPVGSHPSVSRQLPDLLAMLDTRSVPCTFFVEAWNYQHYSTALDSIAAHGHEIGWHGWLHEPWYQSTPETVAESLRKSIEVFERYGHRPVGARPPGGLLGDHDLRVLAEVGFEYVSLAGNVTGAQNGLALLPFPWSAVDGAYYLDSFAALREPPGQGAVDLDSMLSAYDAYLERTIAASGLATFVFHVPWQDRPERVAAIATLIDRIAADDRVWLASGEQIARWMLANPDTPRVRHTDSPPAW